MGRVLFVAVLFALLAGTPVVGDEPEWDCWLPKDNAIRMMKFHGGLGLKVDGATVSIRRNGKWIIVYR